MNAALLDILTRMSGRRVLLVGDFMLDRYVIGDVDRISPEAPVPVLRVVERQDRAGGAGSVALNVRALGAEVDCVGVLGRDAFGERVEALLSAAGASADGMLRVADRPTTTKTRLIGRAEHRHQQQILRVDDEMTAPLAEEAIAALLQRVRTRIDACDAVCLEDYAKGVLAARLCETVIDLARQAGKPVLVDPPRDRDWSKFRRATLLTPNRSELEVGCGRTLRDTEIDEAAAQLLARLELDALVVTLGRDGARLVAGNPGGAGWTARHFPTCPRAVYDNTGAGDAVLAMLAVALAAGAGLDDAVPLANLAGGLEVGKFGCVPITLDEVRAELSLNPGAGQRKLKTLPELQAELAARRARGETVVFTNGCFDLLHGGHVRLLERARAQGSLLVVGLNSDDSVRRLNKGPDRPIRSQLERAHLLCAQQSVDYVVIFDESSVEPLVAALQPDVLVKGGDYSPSEVVGHEIVEKRGGRVIVVEFVEGFSTSRELEKIRMLSAATNAPTAAP